MQRGLSNGQVIIIEQYLNISGDNKSKIEQLNKLLICRGEGISELEFHPGKIPSAVPLIIDFTLARGLNRITTGIIFEVKAPESVKIGSIGGGGRCMTTITGLFGVPDIPGVGISFCV